LKLKLNIRIHYRRKKVRLRGGTDAVRAGKGSERPAADALPANRISRCLLSNNRGFELKNHGFWVEDHGLRSKSRGFLSKDHGLRLKSRGFLSKDHGLRLINRGFLSKDHGLWLKNRGFLSGNHDLWRIGKN
jgi:hypothetical protein